MIENTEELQGQLIASGNVVASMISQKGAKGDKGDKGDTGTPGTDGTDGFSPIITTEKQGKVTTLTIVDAEGTKTATILDGNDGSGTGDMLKATYDQNNNGIVDNAEKVNNHTVLSDVPADAVFTDTTYTAGTGISISAENVISNTQTSAAWGNITGTLSNQTDLNNVLNNTVKLTGTQTITGYKTFSGGIGIESSSYFKGNIFSITDSDNNNVFTSDIDEGTSFSKKVSFNSGASTSVTPTSNNDLANKKYVDDNVFSGNYNDLSNKPTIPTKTSDLNNDSNFEVNTNKVTSLTSLSTDTQYPSAKCVYDELDDKQDTLVSGTSIKTINNNSILGSGNLDVGASIPVQDTAPLNPSEDDLWIDTSGGEATNIVDLIYPVGSIVIKADNQDYSSWLGFTWERTLVGRVAVGIDSTQTEFDTIGETGGEKKHQLTYDELPSQVVTGYCASDKKAWSTGSWGDYSSAAYPTNTVQNSGHGTGEKSLNILQPYQVVAFWKRTA